MSARVRSACVLMAGLAFGWLGGAYTQDLRCDEALDYAYQQYSEQSYEPDCEGDDDCVQQCVDSLQPDEDPEATCFDVLGKRDDEEEE